jgi:putative FmdB family regulatory protein
VPLYAFTCEGCGPFELIRPMVEASAPARCPDCGTTARRVFTPPGLALLAAPLRRVLDDEHKSAHEPDVVAERHGRPMPHDHHHHHGHGSAPPWVLSH